MLFLYLKRIPYIGFLNTTLEQRIEKSFHSSIYIFWDGGLYKMRKKRWKSKNYKLKNPTKKSKISSISIKMDWIEVFF